MKTSINLFFLTIFSLSFAQDKDLYLEINDNQITEHKNDIVNVYEIQMPVKHLKGKDIDYYNFIINSNEKSLEEIGTEILNPKFLCLEDLQKMSSCETHELFSNTKDIFLIKKDSKNVYRKWICMYIGTVKNRIKTKGQF